MIVFITKVHFNAPFDTGASSELSFISFVRKKMSNIYTEYNLTILRTVLSKILTSQKHLGDELYHLIFLEKPSPNKNLQ